MKHLKLTTRFPVVQAKRETERAGPKSELGDKAKETPFLGVNGASWLLASRAWCLERLCPAELRRKA